MLRLILMTMILFSSLIYSHDWWERNTNTKKDLLCVSAPDDSVAWICGKDGTLLLTTSGGKAWINKSGNPAIGNIDLISIFAIDANNVLCTASPETDPNTHETTTYIYRTSDRGGTWTKVFTQKGTIGNGIFMFDKTRGVFYANPINGKWQIWLTNDGGKSWDSTGVRVMAAGTSESGRINAFFGDQDYRVFRFGTNNSRYYQTSDYGKTWKSVVIPGSGNINTLAFSADSGNATKYGLVGGTKLYRTLDNGNTWQELTQLALGNGEIISMLQHDFWEVVLIRESPQNNPQYSLYQSFNFGENPWDTTFKAPDKNEYTYLTEARLGGYFFCIRKGGGITVGEHPNDPKPTGVENNLNSIPAEYVLDQNYPNPFNPSTTISYSIPKESVVELKVYNVLGREIAALVNKEQKAGNYNVQFNASSLPSGIYIYTLKAGQFSSSRKLLLLK